MTHNLNQINQNNQFYNQKPKINTPFGSMYMANTIQGSGDMGKLIPIFVRELLPNQTINLQQTVAIQFMPFVSNLFHEINGEIMTYAVPHRLLWDKWEDFITGGEDGQNDDTIPSFDLKSYYDENGTLLGTLADAFGMPIDGESMSETNDLQPNIFPWRAYNKVYNDAIRYIDVEDEVDIDQNEILTGHWNNDRFTRARIFQQRGIVPTIPVSDELQELTHKITMQAVTSRTGLTPGNPYPLKGYGQSDDKKYYGEHPAVLEKVSDKEYIVGHWGSQSEWGAEPTGSATAVWGYPLDVKVDDHNLTELGMNLNDLLVGMGILKYEVNNAKIKPRYGEQMQARFGVFPQDARLQMPEYVGSNYFNIAVDTVTQTSAGGEGQTQQGNITGQAWGAGQNLPNEYKAFEHCILISIMVIKPKSVYEGGLNRMWMKKTRFDYPTPELYNLPDVPIYKGELKYTGDEETDKAIFGWCGIYDEYRTMSNEVTGLLRPSQSGNLVSYTLARTFEEAPSLNADFVQCVPDKNRIVQFTDEPTFIYFARNELRTAIPMALQNDPVSLNL